MNDVTCTAARNMRKLKLFRQFYLMVVSYIYFTRIIIYLVDATLPFRLVWLGDFFTELATIGFLSVTGYKFRPGNITIQSVFDVNKYHLQLVTIPTLS